ncbi:MAG: outer membrane beta-barrel protein [Spirosomataceae bacterium]
MKQLLVSALCLLTFAVRAQTVEWGLKAGVQLSQFRGDDFISRPPTSSSSSTETVSSKGGSHAGYTVGGYVRSVENVFLQGELLLSVKGGELNRKAANTTTKIQYGQLDIPLSLGVRIKHLEFTGGPLLSLQLFDDGKLKTFLSQYSNSPLTFSPYRTYAFGYHAGAGLNFNKLTLGVRYLASIQGVSDMYIAYTLPGDSQLRDSHFQQRFAGFQLTAAYRLSK